MLGLALRLISGAGVRTLRVPLQQVTIATVERGVFHDLIPLHASVVPRETVYVDATDGGQVNRVLVEPGDMVQAGQPCQPARKVDQLPASNIDQGGTVVEGSSVSDFI
jgi:HlyD family secretion protein